MTELCIGRARIGADPRSLPAWLVPVLGLIFSLVLQLGMFVYCYGRLTERVDVIERNTQKLLDLHLSNQSAKGREHNE